MRAVAKNGTDLDFCGHMRFALFLLLQFAVASGAGAQTDTVYRVQLRNQDVASTRTWENDTLQYHYNQMKYYVTTILPYLEEAVVLFREIDQRLADPACTGAVRKAYLRDKERVVRVRFEDRIRSLNETQGVLLIKLCARQTGLNLYHQVSEVKGGFEARKWQAWARVHGFSLNRRYRPEEEPDLERIMRNLGYPLPAVYGVAEAE